MTHKINLATGNYCIQPNLLSDSLYKGIVNIRRYNFCD